MTPSQYNIRRRSDLLTWAAIFVILWGLILWGIANAEVIVNPALCDGTDRGAELQALFNSAGRDYLKFPSHVCKSNRGLYVPNMTGLVDANLDFSGAPPNQGGLTIGGPIDHLTSSTRYENPVVRGNGQGVGFQINTPGVILRNPTAHDFNIDAEIGDNGYIIKFENPNFYDAHNWVFACPTGVNVGEQIVVDGGSFADSPNGIWNHNCALVLNGTSIDGIAATPLDTGSDCSPGHSASVSGTPHFEEFADPSGSAWIQLQGCNNFTHLNLGIGTEFWASGGTSRPLINNYGAGSYAKIHDVYFVNFPISLVTAVGAGASRVQFCHNTTSGKGPMNNVPDSSGC